MTDAEAKELLVRAVVVKAETRARAHLNFIPQHGDPPEIQKARKEALIHKLHAWARDPVLFIQDNAWVADRRNLFGSESIPSGLSPSGMVPLIMFSKLEEVIREVDRLFESGEEVDVFIDKPRQFALTTSLFGWWLLHKWLFRKSFSFVIGSGKGPDEIDAGGKGKRDDTSLFGRLRMFLDAFLWNLSYPNADGTRTSLLKFNQHMAPRGTGRNGAKALAEWRRNFTGLSDSDDSKNYLSRPRWVVCGQEVFPEAEKNWIVGETPGPSFARSKSGTGAGIDEFPHCNENIAPDTDRLSWASCAVNTRFRMAIGTWPRGGSSGTEMYRRLRAAGDPTTRFLHVHWTDLPVYLFGAHWECPLCGHANGWDHTETTGHEGVVKACSGCLKETRVTRFLVTSPWFRRACAKLGHDRVSIASEILNDPEGTVEDRLFSPWRATSGVRAVPLPDRDRLVMLEGFDPGTSAANPACWILAALDTRAMRLHIVGYWMAANTFVEWWAPFIKRWSERQLARMEPNYGLKSDHRLWLDAFEYDEGAMGMIRRVSARRPADEGGGLVYPLGLVGGDKYGSHRNMMESPYERLLSYGVEVYEEYTADRPALVRKGVEWSSRVTIDPEIADIEPPGPLGPFPSLRRVFEGARVKPVTGQGEYKFDVDKQEPANVSHAVDAFLYLIRLLDERVRSIATVTGDFEQEGGFGAGSEPFRYAG